ncbi:MAG: methyltransferase domain-containing protein, partial [Verrucomicrobiota bacterium]
QGDMADLSAFDDGSFDLIFHPVSNCFAARIRPVWKECHRVLKPGGRLLSGFMNPVFFLFGDPERESEADALRLKYAMPFSDLESVSEERRQELEDQKDAFEFGHSLEDQIGGQIDAGFAITGFFEDSWEDEATPLNQYLPVMMATLAVRA